MNGSTVGWLVLAPFEEGTADADRRFQRSQTRGIAGVAVLALLMAAALGWWLSRRLTRPVTQLAHATHRLAAGHHDVRVDLDRRDEIGVLADDFNRLAETLERNQTLRKEFLADVSHELRTPLAVLRGEMEAMQDGLMPLHARRHRRVAGRGHAAGETGQRSQRTRAERRRRAELPHGTAGPGRSGRARSPSRTRQHCSAWA